MGNKEFVEKIVGKLKREEYLKLCDYFSNEDIEYIEDKNVIDFSNIYGTYNSCSDFIITDSAQVELIKMYYDRQSNEIIKNLIGFNKSIYKESKKICLLMLNHIMPPEDIFKLEIEYIIPKVENSERYIYGIIIENEIVYIGKSSRTEFGTRLMEHFMAEGAMYDEMREKGSKFIVLAQFANISDYELEEVEKLLIGLMKPRYNKEGLVIPYKHRASSEGKVSFNDNYARLVQMINEMEIFLDNFSELKDFIGSN